MEDEKLAIPRPRPYRLGLERDGANPYPGDIDKNIVAPGCEESVGIRLGAIIGPLQGELEVVRCRGDNGGAHRRRAKRAPPA